MFPKKIAILLCICAFSQINAQFYSFPKLNLTVSWKVGQNTTMFTLVYNRTDPSDKWIAVAINQDEEMDGGNALICFIANSTANWVAHYHLDGSTPKLFDELQPSFGIKDSSILETGSQIICNFERENYLTKDRYQNSLQDLYILTAMGSGGLKYHSDKRAHTPGPVSLKLIQQSSTTATTTSSESQGSFLSDGWHYFPNLNMVVYWLLDETKTKFTIEFDKPSNFANGWFAVGFNTQPKMYGGNGAVCVINNNTDFSVRNYHFDGYTPKYFSDSAPSWGLSAASVVHEGTLVTCTFDRENVMNSSRYISTNQDVYLLASYGAGSFAFHGINKAVSEKSYSLARQSTETPQPDLPFNWTDFLDVEFLENLRNTIYQYFDQVINYLKAINLQNIFNFSF